jgi:murein DD-endopeptidase MepM/ murein hydrolase activator NlpD
MPKPLHYKALLCSLLFLWSAWGVAAPRQAAVPGGLAWVELPASLAADDVVRFEGQRVLTIERAHKRQALVGIPLATTAGEQALEVEHADHSTLRLPFTVDAKNYPTQHVTIKDHGKVELSPENEARVAGEHAEIAVHKKSFRPIAAPDIDFVAPAKGRWSGRFGARRIFNGQPRAPHVGLDFAVPRGAPVVSAAAGTVLAVADYFFNGRTVFVDHGQGLITMYCHLERIDVAPGQTLARGEALGRVGSSGRASGPHLHWSVILNGAMVDPELFLPAPAKRGAGTGR